MNLAYYRRRLVIWFERRRLTLAKALVWLAKKIYAGAWNPPSIYDISYGVISHHLKVRNVAAEHHITPAEAYRLGAHLPAALEQHRQAMLHRMIDLLLANKFVKFEVVRGIDGVDRYRAGIKVVEQPVDITSRKW